MKLKIAVFHHEIQDEHGQTIRDRSIVLEYELGPSFVFEITKTNPGYLIKAQVTNSSVMESGTSAYKVRASDHTTIALELKKIIDQEFTSKAYTYPDRTTPEYKTLMKEWNNARHQIIGDAAEGFFPKPTKQLLKNE